MFPTAQGTAARCTQRAALQGILPWEGWARACKRGRPCTTVQARSGIPAGPRQRTPKANGRRPASRVGYPCKHDAQQAGLHEQADEHLRPGRGSVTRRGDEVQGHGQPAWQAAAAAGNRAGSRPRRTLRWIRSPRATLSRTRATHLRHHPDIQEVAVGVGGLVAVACVQQPWQGQRSRSLRKPMST